MSGAYQCDEFFFERYDQVGSFEQPAGSDPAPCDVSVLTQCTAQDIIEATSVSPELAAVLPGCNDEGVLANRSSRDVVESVEEFQFDRFDQVYSFFRATCGE